MADDFKFSNSAATSAPARRAAAITPNDTNIISTTRAILIGGAGDLAVLFADDTASVVLKGLVAGSILPIRVQKVLATGTTATNLVALY
ncbi:spike base protein, RCAP_Rcc01079 family [Sphingomonas sp. GB1N7]|uniref:spike base protein, RCAP_Rcc01079 family n=1 Tax=Parasphingomonas caseinilytica TaxID=3096158 RepID=UPI002FC81BB3